MNRRTASVIVAAAVALLSLVGTAGAAVEPDRRPVDVPVAQFGVPQHAMEQLRTAWLEQLHSRHPAGTWAPMKMELDDDHLALLGLPSAEVLRSRSYPTPTMVDRAGNATPVALPTVATYAGTGYFGIRPGAFLLLLSGDSIGWCSTAHVVGSPGSYDITTAGHCGRSGDTATVIAAFGDAEGVLNPILLDFGRFATSHDNELGDDWAIIDIEAEHQGLVTPTMPVWGGPRGTYRKQGAVASVTFPKRGLLPTVGVTPDPLLAQTLVHYGHGSAVGTGGTPRAGETVHWGSRHFMFFGAISPGDSGSGANTLAGDAVGATMQAAGIMTHLWIDPLMRDGLGIMGGTRSTVVGGVADGQIVPYPVPVPGAP